VADEALFKVGFRQGVLADPARRNWDDDAPRPIRWSVWYPAGQGAIETPVLLPLERPLFHMGKVAIDAPLAGTSECFPVVLLSHGTGGSATSLGWLAGALAAAGHVVIVDHHGNTAGEPYRAEGFLCWWERPRDLTNALDVLIEQEPFAGRLDLDQVTAAGFSLGGYTVLGLLGAATQMELFEAFAREQSFGKGPREFPDLVERIESLFETSPVFRASWQRQSVSTLDARVKAGFACAPAPTVRGFTIASLVAIATPVAMVVGEVDREAPADTCATWLHEHLPNGTLEILPEIGHYQFLSEGTELGRREEPHIWRDPPDFDRRAFHARIADLAVTFLAPA
jgi:predicted dienelactone hydrolase